MERALILLVAALMVYVAPGVQGTAHLSFNPDLPVNISRTGCGVTKLCLETPTDCDPAGSSNCLFSSVTATIPVSVSGTNLSVELSGSSAGYIAVGLTANLTQSVTSLFICAQNSSNGGSFFFRTMQRNNSNDMLSPTETNVIDIRGTVNGTLIQCEFTFPNVGAVMPRNPATTFSVLLGTGPVTANGIGPFNVSLDSGPLDITNPFRNTSTTPAPMTNVTMTTASSGAVYPHAVLLLLSVLMLSVMQTS